MAIACINDMGDVNVVASRLVRVTPMIFKFTARNDSVDIRIYTIIMSVETPFHVHTVADSTKGDQRKSKIAEV